MPSKPQPIPPRREADEPEDLREELIHSLQKYVKWNVPQETVVRLVNEVMEYAEGART